MFEMMSQAGVLNSAKMHLDGQVAGSDFFNTHARRDAQKKSPFLPRANLGGFGLLKLD